MHRSSRRFLLPLILSGGLLIFGWPARRGGAAEPGAAAPRPNILVILLDDLGFSDLGCYGGEIQTPNMDRLAENGLRFTQFYNASRCCPTRAALMTGLYPHQVGLRYNGRSLTHDGVTIAEVLRAAGYQTAMAGKWHLSKTLTLDADHLRWVNHQIDPPGQPFGPIDSYPIHRGFQRHYGIIWGVIDYYDPFSLVEGERPVKEVPDGYYITDAITDYAVRCVRDMARRDRPFFLYVAHCAPHWPLHALPEDIAKYRDAYRDGWHALREARYRRQIEKGLFDPASTPLPELMGRGSDWDELDRPGRKLQAAKMAVHAAMVDRVDQGVGRVLAALEATGRLDDTILFVLADNGASPEVPAEPGYDRTGATRDGTPVRYRGFAPEEIGGETTYTGIGAYWANAANTPFRYWKKESFEGGNHTPLIVHWPAGLKTPPGGVTAQTGHVIDVMPTCLELAGAEYPQTFGGHDVLPVEGRSLVPILRGERRQGHPVLYFEHEGGRAVRQGNWKLVAAERRRWELYDMATDRTETTDLADRHPQRVAQMAAMWDRWAEKVKLRQPPKSPAQPPTRP
ncbi:MAG: arylsulfatase [Pirellulales bacterium]|nr:arylsulfatase [Pirellulales bacterium]